MNPRFLMQFAVMLGVECAILVCYLMVMTSDFTLFVKRLIFAMSASGIALVATWLFWEDIV